MSNFKNYALSLVEFLPFNSIPNIDVGKNKFYVGNEEIIIPTGSYEVSDIDQVLHLILKNKGINFRIKPNNNTLKCTVYCVKEINFKPNASIGSLLFFYDNRSIH